MLTEEHIDAIRQGIDQKREKFISSVFRALSDPHRLCVFIVLLEREKLCVTDVSKILYMSLPAASQHLRILESNGLIFKEREGKMTCYSIDHDHELVPELFKILMK